LGYNGRINLFQAGMRGAEPSKKIGKRSTIPQRSLRAADVACFSTVSKAVD
jgi:hypothetical protein